MLLEMGVGWGGCGWIEASSKQGVNRMDLSQIRHLDPYWIMDGITDHDRILTSELVRRPVWAATGFPLQAKMAETVHTAYIHRLHENPGVGEHP